MGSAFQKYFGLTAGAGAPLFKVLGRTHPIEVFHVREPQPDYVEAAVRTVRMIYRVEDPGDDPNSVGPLSCIPLYSSLSPQQLQRVLDDTPCPTCPGVRQDGKWLWLPTLLSRPWLDGIVHVVDPGFSMLKFYNPRIRVNGLLVNPISKASAQQRAGRAVLHAVYRKGL